MQPPEILITNPTVSSSTAVTTSTITLGGSATDNKAVTRVSWSNDRGAGGEAALTGGSWLVRAVPLQPGANVLTVTACDASGNSATATLTVTYNRLKQDQAIAFPAIANRTFGDAPIQLKAGASSGLPVSFSVLSGPASLSAGNQLNLLGAGVVTVQSSQDGNDSFNPAPQQQLSFTVAKADQAISFATLPDKSAGDSPFLLTATASSGLPVCFDILAGPAVLDTNNTVTLLAGGTVTVCAWQPGNSNYNAAVTAQRSFNVAKLSQTISFGALSSQTVGDAPFPLLATASSGLPVDFSILAGPAVLSGNILTLTSPGTVTVRASQAGNGTYARATDVDQSFEVAPGNPTPVTVVPLLAGNSFTITFATIAGLNYTLEFTDTLNPAQWRSAQTMTGDGNSRTVSDIIGTSGTRFYRLRITTSP